MHGVAVPYRSAQLGLTALVSALAAVACGQSRPASVPAAGGPPVSGPATQPASQPAVRTPRLLWRTPLKSNSFGGAAVADVDGDGRLEVAFATYFGDSAVHVLRGADGHEVWKYQGGEECLDASLRFSDINGDGKLELVVPVSNSSLLLAFDAAGGKLLWKYEAGYGECTDTPPAIVDVDGDAKPEIVIGTFKGHLHIVRGADGTLARKLKVAPGAVQSCPLVLDLNGDGVTDFVAANFRGDHRVHAVDGKTGAELWFVQAGDHMYHGPSLGDLDGDGQLEMAIGAYDGKIRAFRARDGEVLWTVAPGDRYFMSPTAMADVDGDGRPEVLAASQRISAIRSDGSILWSVAADESNGFESVTRGVSVADLDGDGGPDVAYLNSKGLFRVLRGRDGARLYEYDAAKAVDQPIVQNSHGVTIADLDADGKLDVFFVVGGDSRNKHGAAICLTGFAGSGPGWTMLRHDHRNTGNVGTALEPALVERLKVRAASSAPRAASTRPSGSGAE